MNTPEEIPYSIVAYDKDGDVYDVLATVSNETMATKFVEVYKKDLSKGRLKREDNKEPYDWLEVYKDFNKDNEEIVWTSYEREEEIER